MKNVVFCLTALLFGIVSAQVPIPNRPDGYGVGGPADAHVVIEVFFDPVCPSCKAAWPTVLQLIQAYGTRIHTRIHTFPLPFHTYSFALSQGLHVVANATNRSTDAIFNYATQVLANQQKWYNDATSSMNMGQVVDSLATFIDQSGILSKDKFLAGMSNDDINYETRVSWKYACSRGVAGTPKFFVNGVFVDAGVTWSFDEWKKFVDSILIISEKSTARVRDCPSGQVQCEYAPHKTQCCLAGERCIPNVGCRCFNLRTGNVCVQVQDTLDVS